MPQMKTELPSVKKVGIWVRVSTEDQARGESPEHHEKRARYYAEAKGWTVATVYHLEGVSGKAVLDHPEAQRMLGDIRAHAISGLIFSKIARLARNTRELLDLADVFAEYSADLISLQEAIDTSTPAGRLFYTIIAAMAQWEREEIAERVAASIPIRAKLGKSLGGAAPFGYRWVDKKLELDEKEAPIRRLLFELFAEHKRKRTVARILNDAGHRTRGGGKWTGKSLENLLIDPVAKGLRRANYRNSPGRGLTIKAPSEWVYIPAPAIVTAELWDTCNAIVAQQKSPHKQPAKKGAHLFSGLVWCESCTAKMYVRWKGVSYICSKCRNKVAEDDLETVFVEQLRGFVVSPEQVRSHLEAADSRLSEKRQLLASLEEERQNVSADMERAYRLYSDGHLSGTLFAERNAPLEQRRNQLDDELPRLRAEVDVIRLQLLSADEVISEAVDLCARWSKLLFEEKRQIVEGITERILIGDNEITIHLAYLPSPPSPASPTTSKGGVKRSTTLKGSRRPRAENAPETPPHAPRARSRRAHPRAAAAWRRARGAATRGVRREKARHDGRGSPRRGAGPGRRR